MHSAAYITNDEIAAYMDGYIKQAKDSGTTVPDATLIRIAADSAAWYYRKTAMATSDECMGYYAAWKEAN